MKRTPVDFTDRIRVVANVHDLGTNKYSIELEYRDVNGNWSHVILPRSIIRSGVNASNELLDRGANIPTGPGAGAQLAHLLSATPDRTYRITGKTGWHGKSFVLPNITIGPDTDTLLHASRKSGEPVQPATKGSLDRWLPVLIHPK